MPIIKSAKKKMRKDKKRTAHNKLKKDAMKMVVKNMRKTPNKENFASVESVLDKAVKTNYIHINKASRLKSRLSKLLAAK